MKKADYDLKKVAQRGGNARLGIIAVLPAAPTAPAPATKDNDDFTGEFPPEMQAFTSQFAGLPPGEIARIFSNKSRPMNLYKLQTASHEKKR